MIAMMPVERLIVANFKKECKMSFAMHIEILKRTHVLSRGYVRYRVVVDA